VSAFDLEPYLARIGYSGPKIATLGTLRDIAALHPAAIPFENLDVLLKRPIRLDPDSLMSKLVHQARGGYCFEHNTLLQAALRELGFSVSAHAARVQWRQPEGALNARTHMVLRVRLPEGDVLVDAGFGGLTLTAPLRFAMQAVQETPHGSYRLVPVGEEVQLQAMIGGAWEPVYLVSLHEQQPADWEMANWFTSTHPTSRFTRELMAARPVGGDRLGLLNNALSIHRADGTTERRKLETPSVLAAVLRDEFGIDLPEGGAAVLEGLFVR
jgi:N-hydroxyarylamine O-acetyltransferase